MPPCAVLLRLSAGIALTVALSSFLNVAAAHGRVDVPSPVADEAHAAHDLSYWCRRVTPRLPRVDHRLCVQSGLLPTGAHSSRKFPILSRHISADSGAGQPLRILLVGGIHGDELTSSAIVFEWMRIQALAERQDWHWHFVPLLNPDGLLAARPSRVNANGVDLNRNFPTPDWQREAPMWWVTRTGRDPRRFPGHAPLSESETRFLHSEIERLQPDLLVSVHAPFGVLDFDGPASPPKRFGSLRMRAVGVFPGSLGNYGGIHRGIPVITIELPHARRMPSRAESLRIWQDMLRWIAYALQPQANSSLAADEAPTRNEPGFQP